MSPKFLRTSTSVSARIEKLQALAKKGIDVSKAMANTELLIEVEKSKQQQAMRVAMMENQIKIWVEGFKQMAVVLGTFIGSSRFEWKKLVADIVTVFIDAMIQVVNATMLALAVQAFIAGKTAQAIAGLAKAILAITALTALKYGVASLLGAGAGSEATPVAIGIGEDKLSGIGSDMQGIGGFSSSKESVASGRAVQSGYSQTVNYITVAPEFDMLDISAVSEQRLKEIATIIGKYIQEAMATGQFGLKR